MVDETDFPACVHVDLAEAEKCTAGRLPLAIELAAAIAGDHLPDFRGLVELRAIPQVLMGAEIGANLVIGLE
jgi:hypothetical protein